MSRWRITGMVAPDPCYHFRVRFEGDRDDRTFSFRRRRFESRRRFDDRVKRSLDRASDA